MCYLPPLRESYASVLLLLTVQVIYVLYMMCHAVNLPTYGAPRVKKGTASRGAPRDTYAVSRFEDTLYIWTTAHIVQAQSPTVLVLRDSESSTRTAHYKSTKTEPYVGCCSI